MLSPHPHGNGMGELRNVSIQEEHPETSCPEHILTENGGEDGEAPKAPKSRIWGGGIGGESGGARGFM